MERIGDDLTQRDFDRLSFELSTLRYEEYTWKKDHSKRIAEIIEILGEDPQADEDDEE